jgi:hypothetical protein
MKNIYSAVCLSVNGEGWNLASGGFNCFKASSLPPAFSTYNGLYYTRL